MMGGTRQNSTERFFLDKIGEHFECSRVEPKRKDRPFSLAFKHEKTNMRNKAFGNFFQTLQSRERNAN